MQAQRRAELSSFPARPWRRIILPSVRSETAGRRRVYRESTPVRSQRHQSRPHHGILGRYAPIAKLLHNALARPAEYRREIGDSLRSVGPCAASRPRGDILRRDRAPMVAVQGTDGACLTSNSDCVNFWVDGRGPGRQRNIRPSRRHRGEWARRLLRGVPFSRRQGNEIVPSRQ
jgi:hypothetical protein